MANRSLFSACRRASFEKMSKTFEIGGTQIFVEYYDQEDIDNQVPLGNSDEHNIVLVCGDEIVIPEDATITTAHPKKCLVFMCNTFINNGTVSMTGKAPNVLPHDLYLLGKSDNYVSNIVVPAYAGNEVSGSGTKSDTSTGFSGLDGADGVARNCGSGGTGSISTSRIESGTFYFNTSGSGTAFGGGAGSSGYSVYNMPQELLESCPSPVDSTYPMQGSDALPYCEASYGNVGGVGNPAGLSNSQAGSRTDNNSGCGGRIVVFCSVFENNGTIECNGVDTIQTIEEPDWGTLADLAWGGASGAGAVDIFYKTLSERGDIQAEGGQSFVVDGVGPGAGGDGSTILTQWEIETLVDREEKYMSYENMIYFLQKIVDKMTE